MQIFQVILPIGSLTSGRGQHFEIHAHNSENAQAALWGWLFEQPIPDDCEIIAHGEVNIAVPIDDIGGMATAH